MKNIIKILSLSLIFISSLHINAQTFGLHAGIDFVNPVSINLLYPMESEFRFSPIYKLGPTVDFELSERVFFTTGLWAGYRSSYTQRNKYVNRYDTKTVSAEIPILFRFVSKAEEFKFFWQFGPTVNSEVYSKFARENTEESVRQTRSFTRTELGSQFGIGVEADNFRLGIDYKVPMLIFNDEGNKNVEDFGKIGLSLVFKFGQNK